jgi:hypothetical protein
MAMVLLRERVRNVGFVRRCVLRIFGWGREDEDEVLVLVVVVRCQNGGVGMIGRTRKIDGVRNASAMEPRVRNVDGRPRVGLRWRTMGGKIVPPRAPPEKMMLDATPWWEGKYWREIETHGRYENAMPGPNMMPCERRSWVYVVLTLAANCEPTMSAAPTRREGR